MAMVHLAILMITALHNATATSAPGENHDTCENGGATSVHGASILQTRIGTTSRHGASIPEERRSYEELGRCLAVTPEDIRTCRPLSFRDCEKQEERCRWDFEHCAAVETENLWYCFSRQSPTMCEESEHCQWGGCHGPYRNPECPLLSIALCAARKTCSWGLQPQQIIKQLPPIVCDKFVVGVSVKRYNLQDKIRWSIRASQGDFYRKQSIPKAELRHDAEVCVEAGEYRFTIWGQGEGRFFIQLPGNSHSGSFRVSKGKSEKLKLHVFGE